MNLLTVWGTMRMDSHGAVNDIGPRRSGVVLLRSQPVGRLYRSRGWAIALIGIAACCQSPARCGRPRFRPFLLRFAGDALRELLVRGARHAHPGIWFSLRAILAVLERSRGPLLRATRPPLVGRSAVCPRVGSTHAIWSASHLGHQSRTRGADKPGQFLAVDDAVRDERCPGGTGPLRPRARKASPGSEYPVGLSSRQGRSDRDQAHRRGRSGSGYWLSVSTALRSALPQSRTAQTRRCGGTATIRGEPDASAARFLVEPAPLAQPRGRIHLRAGRRSDLGDRCGSRSASGRRRGGLSGG